MNDVAVVVLVVLAVLVTVAAVVWLRRPARDEGPRLMGNDPAPYDDPAQADARGAVNKNSWMLGGGGGGGGG
ncbi:hypothetical protein [Modestobacter lacusdianchii]